MYQVGLMETDQHIEFFWGALEMFTQEELCKFIKFACNQERIPFTCPCKDGGPDTAHVPPYPMKIAPPDGTAGTAFPLCSEWDTQALLSVGSWGLPSPAGERDSSGQLSPNVNGVHACTGEGVVMCLSNLTLARSQYRPKVDLFSDFFKVFIIL